MGFIEEGRQLIPSVEETADKAGTKIYVVPSTIEMKIDRYHNEIMEALNRIESRILRDILDRLARLESKMQNVA